MKTDRGAYLAAFAAGAVLASAGSAQLPRARCCVSCRHGDLKILDPIWTTAYISATTAT